jgi:hypothetical protein
MSNSSHLSEGFSYQFQPVANSDDPLRYLPDACRRYTDTISGSLGLACSTDVAGAVLVFLIKIAIVLLKASRFAI